MSGQQALERFRIDEAWEIAALYAEMVSEAESVTQSPSRFKKEIALLAVLYALAHSSQTQMEGMRTSAQNVTAGQAGQQKRLSELAQQGYRDIPEMKEWDERYWQQGQFIGYSKSGQEIRTQGRWITTKRNNSHEIQTEELINRARDQELQYLKATIGMDEATFRTKMTTMMTQGKLSFAAVHELVGVLKSIGQITQDMLKK